MKIVIFAGGSGRRLWPLSRQQSPKQFEAIIGEKSTLQLAVERVQDLYGAENILISTNEKYLGIIKEQLSHLPVENFIGEPVRRDLAAAVGLAITHVLHRSDPDEPLAIVWGDSYMTRPAVYQELLAAGQELLMTDRAKIVFIGETARFPNENLGWIELGETMTTVRSHDCYAFSSLVYRPSKTQCEQMYASGMSVWNTGYFVTTPGFIGEVYQEHQPEMWRALQQIGRTIDTDAYGRTLEKTYPGLDIIHFDDAVARNVQPNQALVLHGRMGWSDPGTLYALKEAINPAQEKNVVRGLVEAFETGDSLLYNYEEGKLLAAVGLEGMIVVNTGDALLVVHKDKIPLVKEFVNSLIGTNLESYS